MRVLFFSLLIVGFPAVAEDVPKSKPPPFELFRAEENYDYLADPTSSPYEEAWPDRFKYIPLREDGDAWLTIGGQFRPRYKTYTNRDWEADNDVDYYSQRLSLHTNWHIGESVRLFAELYHGYTSHTKEIAEYDSLDWHQGFVEMALPSVGNHRWSLRVGRQELAFGAARLVGIREGPNIRRSFDAARAIYNRDQTTVQTFYGREVFPEFAAFDNDFVLFDHDAATPKLWGIYSQFHIPGDVGPTELYYLGFESAQSQFNDVAGKEKRHSIGIRRFGGIGNHWVYNTEFVYQFGELAGQDIRAWNLETDWHYEINDSRWRPSIGMKLELTSGDNRAADGEINSFNAMFVNPDYYSLSWAMAPVNLRSIHPSLTFYPSNKLKLYLEWARFWRDSGNDGLYRPPRFLARASATANSRRIGDQTGLKISYSWSRYLFADLDTSYFRASKFLQESGEAENMFIIAVTLNFMF